jgi:hypothetical protein
MRYRLDVVGPSVAEVVMHAGGWLFDRVMAGWDVTVLVADHPDDRPLQILGAEPLDLETALTSMHNRPHPQTLAVATELFERDARVRQGVLAALERGLTEVTLWGDTCPTELGDSVDPVCHELSAAAQAFKAQALAAAAVERTEVGYTETFRIGVAATPSVAADLIPAS